MDLKEIFKKINSGEVAAHSELGTRDENKQTRNFGSRIQKMKTVTGINARAMVMKDVVIKFNPFTGKADDTYNKATPFRPILLVSQVLQGLKDAMEESPEMKEFWEKELNITFAPGAPTMDEYRAFKAAGYIKPRVMSYYTVALNFGGVRGFSDFKQKYTIDPTELNEQSSYDYETAPVWHKAAAFFNTMLRAEADEVTKNLESSGANKDAVQSQRRAVFQKAPVSFVSPTNLVPFLFYPLDRIPKPLDPTHPQGIEEYMRYYGFTDKWVTALKDAMTNPLFDEDMDFFDFTIKTPSSSETKGGTGQVYTDEDSFALYQAMTITTTDGRMSLHSGSTVEGGKSVKNEEAYASIIATAHAYFLQSQEQSSTEGGETFEKIMSGSSRFRPITKAMDNFLLACQDVFNSTFANTKYFTEEVKRANSEFFIMMNPQNAVALAAAEDEELAEAAARQKESIAGIIAETTGSSTAMTQDEEILGVRMNAGSGDIGELDLATD